MVSLAHCSICFLFYVLDPPTPFRVPSHDITDLYTPVLLLFETINNNSNNCQSYICLETVGSFFALEFLGHRFFQ